MDALLVRIAERIMSGADPLLSPSEALELARLPESATLDILSVAGLARAARKPADARADEYRQHDEHAPDGNMRDGHV